MVLFVNSCVRDESRTGKLAWALLEKIGDDYTEIRLEEVSFPKTDENFLKKRDSLIASGCFDDDSFSLARQFASADTIVIAAPYWDLSFPASLKQYIEHINVLGITFEYTAEGMPHGLCKAEKLYYIMTAGGSYVPDEFGFMYIKALAQNFYGIGDVELIKATGLDIVGADVESIMNKALADISSG
ncbi:NAD(P)H-dependent oxidoreductase [Oribacterium sp. WCC10]|uniref:NAD(P)H-dependent oxidoreductase n=1 Tax=Oribacterium sp. WCC10 TaxID=1855343 RepID=UPI0008E07DC0|nr:NAD(P)H-dependent oxidoreductase [Oribacterium sp. WCC10]SFG21708.1 FMN-dependent NADH-azoreductase [Oribacterium sp. WCC10]